MGKDKIKLIVEVDKEILFKGFEQPLTEEERMTLIRAIGDGRSYDPSYESSGDMISREALKVKFQKSCCGQCNLCGYCGVGGDCALIDNAPSIGENQNEQI